MQAQLAATTGRGRVSEFAQAPDTGEMAQRHHRRLQYRLDSVGAIPVHDHDANAHAHQMVKV